MTGEVSSWFCAAGRSLFFSSAFGPCSTPPDDCHPGQVRLVNEQVRGAEDTKNKQQISHTSTGKASKVVRRDARAQA